MNEKLSEREVKIASKGFTLERKRATLKRLKDKHAALISKAQDTEQAILDQRESVQKTADEIVKLGGTVEETEETGFEVAE